MKIHDQVLKACEGVPPLPDQFFPWGTNRYLADPAVHDQATVGPVIDEIVRVSGDKLGFNLSYAFSTATIHRRVLDLLVSRCQRTWRIVPCCKPVGDAYTALGKLAETLQPTSPWVDHEKVAFFWVASNNMAKSMFSARWTTESLFDHAPNGSAWLNATDPVVIAGATNFWRMLLRCGEIMFGTILGGSLPDYRDAPKYKSIDAYKPAEMDARIARLGKLQHDEKPVLWVDYTTFPDAHMLATEARFSGVTIVGWPGVTIVGWPGAFHTDLSKPDPHEHLKAYVDFVRRFHGLEKWGWV